MSPNNDIFLNIIVRRRRVAFNGIHNFDSNFNFLSYHNTMYIPILNYELVMTKMIVILNILLFSISIIFFVSAHYAPTTCPVEFVHVPLCFVKMSPRSGDNKENVMRDTTDLALFTVQLFVGSADLIRGLVFLIMRITGILGVDCLKFFVSISNLILECEY